jgi:hypothetical protein
MMMTKFTVLFVILTLTGCARPVVAPLMLPLSVDEAIPSDIDRSEVNRDPEGCYFYTFAAELIVVRDRSGAPICILPQGDG